MEFGIILGSNVFIRTTGVLSVDGKEFFRVREIDRARSEGSYIVIDCDIKDSTGERQVKLFKSRPVVQSEEVVVEYKPGFTQVALRDSGSTIIRIEELQLSDPHLPQKEPAATNLKKVDGVLRITGDFFAGPHHVVVTPEETKIGGITVSGNVSIETKGIQLSRHGFAM